MLDNTAYDVIIAGGGITGVSAAVSAARLGANVLLIERYGFLGGLATAGLVNPFMTHRSSTGKPLIAGFFDDLRAKLAESSGIVDGTFDSEAMKQVLQDMALEAGVHLLLHSWVSGVIMEDDAITGLRVVNKSGELRIFGHRIIDATGDGDVAAAAGVPHESGSKDGLPQAMTMMLDAGGIDLVEMFKYVRDNPDQFRFPVLPPDADPEELAKGIVSVAGYYNLVAQAKAAGDYPLPGDLIFFVSRPRAGEVAFNTTHVGGVDGTNAEDLTRAEIEGRNQATALVRFIRKYVPGFQRAYLLRTAAQIGVRETRRIVGEYVFSAKDVISGQKFDDAIARLAYPVDVHSGKGEGYTLNEKQPAGPPAGDWYEVPYRCLLPIGVENLLVAGRCVSSTHEGQGAIRIMPCCAAMGQAAGTAAAISIKNHISPRNLDPKIIVAALRDQNALV